MSTADAPPTPSTPRRPIAYLVNSYPEPSQSFVWREIGALERRGVDVRRFSIRRGNAPLADETAQAELRKTRAVLSAGAGAIAAATLGTMVARPAAFLRGLRAALKLGRGSEKGLPYHMAYLAEACVLRRWLAGCGARHLHAHFGTNSTMVALLCRELGGPPFSFTCHGPTEFDRPAYIALGEKVRRSAFAVAIGEYGRSQLYRWAGHAAWPKVHVVRCGVDAAYMDPGAVSPPPADRRLVCVGRLVEQKGHLILAEAAARLVADGEPPFELVLIGDGPVRGELEKLIAAKGLSGTVRLAGWMANSQVREEIRRGRAMVLPSFAEGLPVAIMEALAMGRPVITTTVAAIPELVEHRACGWLVPPGSVDRLAAAMREALNADLETLTRMGAAGRARVLENHDAEREAGKLLALIDGTGEAIAAESQARVPNGLAAAR